MSNPRPSGRMGPIRGFCAALASQTGYGSVAFSIWYFAQGCVNWATNRYISKNSRLATNSCHNQQNFSKNGLLLSNWNFLNFDQGPHLFLLKMFNENHGQWNRYQRHIANFSMTPVITIGALQICNMSFISSSLVVIFIVRLFSTSAFRVPKNI